MTPLKIHYAIILRVLTDIRLLEDGFQQCSNENVHILSEELNQNNIVTSSK